MNTLRTQAYLAQILDIPLSTANDLREREGWPHIRIGRKVRYSDDHIAEIIARHTVAAQPKKAGVPVLDGLTERGRARS